MHAVLLRICPNLCGGRPRIGSLLVRMHRMVSLPGEGQSTRSITLPTRLQQSGVIASFPQGGATVIAALYIAASHADSLSLSVAT